jgi:hypothetical protein
VVPELGVCQDRPEVPVTAGRKGWIDVRTQLRAVLAGIVIAGSMVVAAPAAFAKPDKFCAVIDKAMSQAGQNDGSSPAEAAKSMTAAADALTKGKAPDAVKGSVKDFADGLRKIAAAVKGGKGTAATGLAMANFMKGDAGKKYQKGLLGMTQWEIKNCT